MCGQRSRDKDMIEHLRPAMMEHTKPPVLWKCPIDNDQRPDSEMAVPSVFLRRLKNLYRRLMVFGVEVTTDGNEAVRISVKDIVKS